MIDNAALFNDSYTDINGLERLKSVGREDQSAALRATAQQFEALFLQSMLKSMREAVPDGGLFDHRETDMYNGLFDQQIALNISHSRSFGLADAIYRQLSKLPGVDRQTPWQSPQQFVEHVMPAARSVAAQLGVPPEALLSVAALETGWGKNVMQQPDGGSSFNLFGIKSTPDWQGGKVNASTLEFDGTAMQKRMESFRAYDNADQSIRDFGHFLAQQPRYREALNSGDSEQFFNALQQAGYATDPVYAQKLSAVLHSSTMQLALAGR